MPAATARQNGPGQWQACLPAPALAVTVLTATTGAMSCRLTAQPDSAVLTVAFAPWPTATVLRCPLAALPAQGCLSVRDVRVTTRMGRTIRYLIPEFTPA